MLPTQAHLFYLIENVDRVPARLVFWRRSVESVEDSVHQEWESCDPLHGKHQERVHRQRLTNRTRLKLTNHIYETRVLTPAERRDFLGT